MTLIHINGKTYEIIHENRNGWNAEAFRDRYSDVLERYDFIVGDWGYNQLRLKGFYRDNHQKATKDSNLSAIPDYINEYCNFGCAYFIMEKTHSSKQEPVEDLDAEDDEPRLVASDLRAAANASHSDDIEVVEGTEDEATHAAEGNQYQKARNHRSGRKDYRTNNRHSTHSHRPSDKSNGEDNRSFDAERSSGKKDFHPRKSRNYDNRNKKPARLSDHEAAATSDSTHRSNNKD